MPVSFRSEGLRGIFNKWDISLSADSGDALDIAHQPIKMSDKNSTRVFGYQTLHLSRINIASLALDVRKYRNSTRAHDHVHDVGDRVGRQDHMLPWLNQVP